MRTTTGWTITLTLAGGLGACKEEIGAPLVPGPEVALRRMASCDDLRDRLEDVFLEAVVQSRYGGSFAVDVDAVADAESDGAGGDDRGSDAPTDWTGTNNQEVGVDELDLVKSDGTHLFVAQDRGLHVVRSWPAEDTEKLATIELDGWASGLFLHGDRVVVLQQVDGASGVGDVGGVGGVRGDGRFRGGTRLTVVDVSDPASPEVLREVDVEGWLADARLIDGELYAVINQQMWLPDAAWDLAWTHEGELPVAPWEGEEADWEAAREQARTVLAPHVEALVADLDLADLLPAWRTDEGEDVASMYACTDLYAPSAIAPLGMLSLVQLDVDSGELGSTGLMAQGWTVYASRESLYVAQSSQWWWGWRDDGMSHVHKLVLEGSAPRYVASGQVSGWMYDQFAMSEHDGFLRAVTTDMTRWWLNGQEAPPDPANHVYVLEDDGAGTLQVVGHVGGIAPTERIMSARMMGDRGYIVTFRQTDPLFTLDLSDPTEPKVAGELHLPGYSAYLHPVGDDHLLAVGMAGEDDGTLTGLAINLFDVSDMAQPTLAHSLEVGHGEGWSWSEALWDHHAFTYHRDVLTIPAMLEHYDEGTQSWTGFSGTISFEATPEGGIEELGRVDHRDLIASSECLWERWYDWEGACSWDQGYWYAQVRRSVYVEDQLYTISDYGVKVNELLDPATEVARVVFYER